MLIAVAAAGERVPERFEDSDRLLLIETETGAVTAETLRGDGPALLLAAAAAESGVEADACGMIEEDEVFEALASIGVTRCFAAGFGAVEAACAAEAGTLPLIVRPGELRGGSRPKR